MLITRYRLRTFITLPIHDTLTSHSEKSSYGSRSHQVPQGEPTGYLQHKCITQ